jgi:precorrin-3B methylase
MCSPLAAVSAIVGGAQTVSSIAGQRQQARMQEQAQRTATQQERQRYLAEVSAMRTQQQQEMIARAQRIQEASRKAMEARATARVSAGESGVSGLSIDALLGDLTRKESEYTFSEQRQAEMLDVSRDIQLSEAGIGFNRNMLRINKPIEQPDYLGSALGGFQSGLSTYSSLK